MIFHFFNEVIALLIAVAETECRPETRAKMQGILIKLRSYKFLCQTAVYLNVLESIPQLSLVFEKNTLMAYNIQPTVDQALENLQKISQEDEKDAIDSFLPHNPKIVST